MKKTNSLLLLLAITLLGSPILYFSLRHQDQQEFIPVGILHSITGIMAPYESNIVDAMMLAIEEINDQGGVLGKKIKPIAYDGKSSWEYYVEGAEYLLGQEKVAVIFGCWTSSSRKAILPILEKYNKLLFYPLQYEGLEESPYVYYMAATSNQQIVPGVVWAFKNLGKKFFLIGADYIYPRASHAINKDVINALGGTVVGEEYIPFASLDVDHIVQKIIDTKPEVILNILVGESNIPFFKKLRAAGITPEKIPTISFTFSELELRNLDIDSMVGDYAALNYFQSIDNRENKEFVERFRARFGADRLLTDYMEAGYIGVHFWAQAVKDSGTPDINAINANLKNQAFNAPEGVVSIDPENHHLWKFSRIGKIQSNGQFNIIWTSAKTVRPIPYLTEYRSKSDWDTYLRKLYEGWGGKWSA